MKQVAMVFWNPHAFSVIWQMLAIWYLVPLPFLNPFCTSGSSQFTYYWNLSWILRIILLACEISAIILCLEYSLCVCVTWSVMSYSLQLHGLKPTRLLFHGILQARILEWVAIPFSRESSWPRNWTQVSHIAGRFFTIWPTRKPISFYKKMINKITYC